MKSKKTGILKVGVTGGIGSGKSTVCKILENLGVPVLYADVIAKDLSTNDPRLREKITRLLGRSAYREDGALNREFIAGRIFSDQRLQKRLNAIVHPEVEKSIEGKFGELAQRGARMVIVEAALVFETGFDKRLDTVIVVETTEETRLSRLSGGDPAKKEEIRKRMKAQWNPSVKRQKGDYVIMNNGSFQQLEEKVRFIHAILQNL